MTEIFTWNFLCVYTGDGRMSIKDPFNDPMGLKGVNIQDKAYRITNPCSKSNDGCQHLCLYKPSGAVCACASGNLSPVIKLTI
jgi:low density lipoprotein receptor-related protein 5/6